MLVRSTAGIRADLPAQGLPNYQTEKGLEITIAAGD